MLHVGNTLRVRALRRISIMARVLPKGVKKEEMNREIEDHMKNQLAELSLGRIVLHLVCACRDHKLLWHWRGILREIRTEAY
jgi:hypothetical protein